MAAEDIISAMTQDQQIAFRTIKVKQFLFDQTIHLNEGEIVAKMPTHHFIEYFNEFFNKLASLTFKEDDFIKFLAESFPGANAQDIMIAKSVFNLLEIIPSRLSKK